MTLEKQGLGIIFHSGSYDRLHHGFSLAMAAAALGREVTLFFTYWALESMRRDAADRMRLDDEAKEHREILDKDRKRVIDEAKEDGELLEAAKQGWDVPAGILCMVLGCFAVYSALFATGYWIYGRHTTASILTAIAAVSTFVLTKAWKKLRLAS